MSRTVVAPSLSKRTMKTSAVVLIGVGRGGVGRDNATCRRLLTTEITNAVSSVVGWSYSES